MRIAFGPFTLDTDTRQLRRGAEERHLTPKAFDLLELLTRERPRALPKSTLLETLWPDTFVVEANLSNLVAELRAALDDDARQPRYVRTVYGRGYAFCAESLDTASPPAPGAAAPAAFCVVVDGRPRPLHRGENVLGRAIEAEVWIDSDSVSRRHAIIRVADGTATLEDLDSKNGTWLHGERLREPASLSDGDEIRVGSVILVFRSSPADTATRTTA
jgi:DNA-binding winged helix-turn-helix (wHTH) protein